MRTIPLAALLVLAAGAAAAQDLSATFTPFAQGVQAQAAARTGEAQSLRAALDRLLSGLGTRYPAPAPSDQPKPVLAALLPDGPRGTQSPPPQRQ